MKRKTTLTDIAKAVGVSRAAAGKVLGTSNSNIRVSKEKSELIRKVAREMNYVPNVVARVLAGQSSKMIGILVDSEVPSVMNCRVRQIEHYAETLGYRVLVSEAHDDIEKLRNNFQYMRQYGVDGVICLSHDYEMAEGDFEKSFDFAREMVLVGGPVRKGFSHVIPDVAKGAELICDCLKQRGCRKVAIVSKNLGSRYYSMKTRFDVFRREFGNNLLRVDTDGKNALDRGENSLQVVNTEIIPRGVDAVICSCDVMALGIESGLLAAGKRVPEDVAVVGYDNDDFAPYAAVPLTTVDQNNYSIAKASVDMLLKQLSEEEFIPELKYIAPELIVRKSC